jgi:signal transduction histidine kinase
MNTQQITIAPLNLAMPSLSLDAPTDKKKTLINIQWFVVIASAYLALFGKTGLTEHWSTYLFILLPLGSILVLQRLPQSVFEHSHFLQALVVVDTIFLSTAIAFNRDSSWDLFLVFFFGIFLATIGETLLQVVLGCIVLSIVSVFFIPLARNVPFEIDPDTLFRIPLLLGASLLYGYMAEQVKTERKRAVELEKSRLQQLQVKDQFLSHVSHELRSPLTAIHQFVTILLDRLAGEINEEQHDYLEIVLRNVKQLETMIGELLEVTRADTGKLGLEPRCIPLLELIPETLNTLSTTAAAKDIRLSADVPRDLPLAYCDPQRVQQILINLIDNATKFTPAKGDITVRAQIYNQDPQFICVAVTDTGCGISPEGTQRIFDRLYQEPTNAELSRKGLGLGLHICHELVVRHGGRIWVKSRLGKGSTFYFTLPIFSLAKLLTPVITDNNRLKENIALITVELSPNDGPPSARFTEPMRREAWQALQGCMHPDQNILLPRMASNGESEVFYIVEGGDPSDTSTFAQLLREHLNQSAGLQNSSVEVTVSSTPLETAGLQNRLAVEQLVEEVSTKIIEMMNSVISEKVKKIKESRSDFFRVISHEIRTPLSVVVGYAGLLRDKLLGELNPEQEEALNKVLVHSSDLLVMINNILDAHKIESGITKVESYEIHVSSLLNELRSFYETSWIKTLPIHWDYPSKLPAIMTDSRKLRAILLNLISNAVKFTENGKVTVSAKYSAEANNLEFQVADTGIGMPESAVPAVFEKFYQLRPTEGNPLGGMGLGLYIVDTFTELLGGKVDVESKPGKGSVFRVTVPVQTAN